MQQLIANKKVFILFFYSRKIKTYKHKTLQNEKLHYLLYRFDTADGSVRRDL